jgi:two-component system, chemotaxis family, response regulator Rcp1
MNTHNSAPIDVLLVDDSPEDVRLTREALKGSRFRIHLKVATNGEEALAVLRHQGRHANTAPPNLVLLDLNMPRMDGFETLAVIKQDAALKCIPVVILTTSDSESDVLRTYELQANAYVMKPAHVDQFESTMKAIENFWIGVAKLPARRFYSD